MFAADDLDLIGPLYDAAIDGTRWPDWLARLAKRFDAPIAQIGARVPRGPLLGFFHVHGIDEATLAVTLPRYLELGSEDLLDPANVARDDHPARLKRLSNPARLEAIVHGAAFRSDELVQHEDFVRSRIYEEVRAPLGMFYHLGKYVIRDSRVEACFNCSRGAEAQPFSRLDCERFDYLGVHVRRAVLVHERMLALDFERRAGLQALETLSQALALVAPDRRLVFANAAARHHLESDRVLRLDGDRVRGVAHSLDRELGAAIERATEAVVAGRSEAGQWLHATQDCNGDSALNAFVTPLWNTLIAERPELVGRPLAAVFLDDPRRDARARVRQWERLFGLTPAQARVLEAARSGDDIETIAAALGIKRDTVRSHFKALYRATGTASRAALIRAAYVAESALGGLA